MDFYRTMTGALLLGAMAAGSGHADEVTLAPIRDNTLYEDVTGSLSNGSGPVFFSGKNGGGSALRALLAFDVAGNLPVGSAIQEVELRLHVANVSVPAPRTHTVHRTLADWGEGASSAGGGGGAPAEPGDATWIHTFYADSLWANAGGDFEAAIHATAVMADTGSVLITGADLIADVQAWLDEPTSNHGWTILGDESESSTARRIDSRESPDPALRPSLRIVYDPDGLAVESVPWGRTKSRYRETPPR